MTITISINITLDPADLVALGNQLAADWTALPQSPLPTEGGAKSAKPTHIGAKATGRPKSPRTDVLAPDVAEPPATPQIAAILPATNEAEATEPETETKSRNTRPREALPFAELDKLVRKEVKRLAMDGRIPNSKLWDSERDQRLPTYGAVLQRYGCANVKGFAAAMGMEPPLSPKRFPEHKGEVYAATA